MWISPRNPPEQNAYLLREASVNLVLYADVMEPAINGIQQVESAALRPYMMVPSLDEILNRQSPPYPFDVLYTDIKDEKCLVMHTSGSTGTLNTF